jgi:hypothetical protein
MLAEPIDRDQHRCAAGYRRISGRVFPCTGACATDEQYHQQRAEKNLFHASTSIANCAITSYYAIACTAIVSSLSLRPLAACRRFLFPPPLVHFLTFYLRVGAFAT